MTDHATTPSPTASPSPTTGSPTTATIAVADRPAQAADHRPGSSRPTTSKTFILDTNVLLHNPMGLFMFEENEVVVPFVVLEELDNFKKHNDDVGRNCREVVRQLDRLRQQGRLSDGVPLNDQGGTVRIEFGHARGPQALNDDTPDNRIIAVAWSLREAGESAILISKDINVRLKADALGIPTEDFEAQKVDIDHLYAGYRLIDCPGEIIDQLYDEKQLEVEALLPFLVGNHPDPRAANGYLYPDDVASEPFNANEFVMLRNALDESHTGLARRLADTEHFIPIHPPRKPVYGILGRNVQQNMALDLLLDDEVKLVTLLGQAGTGKTLLAIAAGLTKVLVEQRYDKLLVARPIMPMGRDIGYLPGDKDEKLSQWMQPIFDNLAYLLSTRAAGNQHADSRPVEQRVEHLLASGSVELEALTYIRGRSIPHQFIIVDEAQNLTPHEVKTIVSRVGEGTKIVLTGDVAQIDNPYLDASSNGMSYMIERLKDSAMVGHITLQKSERSELASLAVKML